MKRLLTALALAAAAGGAAQAQDRLDRVAGTYAGVYQCGTGLIGATLTLAVADGKVDGVLGFYPVALNPGAPSGSFRLSGTIGSNYNLALTPGDWIEQPENYGAAGIEGFVSPSGHLTGKPTGPAEWGCLFIDLRRLPKME